MSDHLDQADAAGADAPSGDTSHEQFLLARERFFARLRADAEVRRLEALWREEAAPAAGER